MADSRAAPVPRETVVTVAASDRHSGPHTSTPRRRVEDRPRRDAGAASPRPARRPHRLVSHLSALAAPARDRAGHRGRGQGWRTAVTRCRALNLLQVVVDGPRDWWTASPP